MGHSMDDNHLLQQIVSDPRYRENIDWGKPRRGHPEGTVRAHIDELERNLDRLRPKLSDRDCERLRVLIHTHDTFKKDAHQGVPITDPRSHASLARAFLSEFCGDPDLLAIVQYHDEPYALWRQFHSRGSVNQDRFDALLSVIRDWNLFLAFNIIDGCTEGKGRESLVWLFEQVRGKVRSDFTVDDLL